MSISKHDLTRSRNAYIIGLVLSIVLTLTSFYLVQHDKLSHSGLIASVATLALLQFATQMYFFLHLGQEAKPRLKLATFWFMLLVVVIVVVGSLWIMNNLNYNMMASPEQVNEYMHSQDGL